MGRAINKKDTSFGNPELRDFLIDVNDKIIEGIDGKKEYDDIVNEILEVEAEWYFDTNEKYKHKTKESQYSQLKEEIEEYVDKDGKYGYGTPKDVAELVSRIVTYNKKRIGSVYDPVCKKGNLLQAICNKVEVDNVFAQCTLPREMILPKYKMISNGINIEKINMKYGDTLKSPAHMEYKFDVIVANPPYATRWDAEKEFLNDPRFNRYRRLAPKSKSDFAYIQHMLYHLKKDGILAVLQPQGTLFRGNAEQVIRKQMVEENNYLDAVIGLAPNVLEWTAIPIVVMIFRKNRKKDEKVMFIDASELGERTRGKVLLSEADIQKIVDTYENKLTIDKFSRYVTLEEIHKNSCNLNIPRYIDTFEVPERIELKSGRKQISDIQDKIDNIDARIIELEKELRLQ